jgi:hypothetical protein
VPGQEIPSQLTYHGPGVPYLGRLSGNPYPGVLAGDIPKWAGPAAVAMIVGAGAGVGALLGRSKRAALIGAAIGAGFPVALVIRHTVKRSLK